MGANRRNNREGFRISFEGGGVARESNILGKAEGCVAPCDAFAGCRK